MFQDNSTNVIKNKYLSIDIQEINFPGRETEYKIVNFTVSKEHIKIIKKAEKDLDLSIEDLRRLVDICETWDRNRANPYATKAAMIIRIGRDEDKFEKNSILSKKSFEKLKQLVEKVNLGVSELDKIKTKKIKL